MMMNALRRLLKSPRFADDRLTRRAELIHVVILTHAFTILLSLAVIPFVALHPRTAVLIFSIWAGTTIVARTFNKRGMLNAAAIATCLPLYLLLSAVVLVSIPGAGANWYFAVILHVVIVGRARWGLFAAIGAFITLTFVSSGAAANLGLPVVFREVREAGIPFAFFAQLVMLLVPAILVIQQQRAAIERAEQELASRRKSDHELNVLNEQLEARVDVRTSELAAANADLEAYSFSVSHDLRSPLNAMMGFSSLLKERSGAALDDKGRQYVERIIAAGDRMQNLINDLLALARVSKTSMASYSIDVTRMAGEVAAALETASPERKVTWQIADGLQAAGDPGLVRILLENLFGNAWKYSSKCDRTIISLQESARTTSSVEFLIADNGVGFDNAYAKQLFMPFRRLHSASEYPGSGIGLATVSRIVVKHGGTIRGVGIVDGGAQFWFSLPTTVQE